MDDIYVIIEVNFFFKEGYEFKIYVERFVELIL